MPTLFGARVSGYLEHAEDLISVSGLSELVISCPEIWDMVGGIMAKVLLVGYVRELLDERDNILRAAGHSPTLAANTAEAFHSAQEQDFDVVVLGFSIPSEERKELARAIKENNAHTKIIMIYFDSTKNTEMADALVKTSAGADGILRAVNHILNMGEQSRTG